MSHTGGRGVTRKVGDGDVSWCVLQEMLLDEVADLCAEFPVHVGLCKGDMLLLNAGTDPDECDVAFFGPLFERAQALALKAAKHEKQILAEPDCEMDVPSVVWEPLDSLVAGRIDY